MADVNTVEYVSSLYARARAAQAQIENYTQEQVDELCKAVAWVACKEENAKVLARMGWEESGMGDYEAKVGKFKKKVPGTLWWLRDKKSVGIVEDDPANQMVTIAKPAGVIASVLPTTNPTVTPVGNGMQILKGRNAVIFCPHPGAKNCSTKMVNYMREAIAEVGAPKDLIQVVAEPSIEMTQKIMSACDVIVATGGAGMVKSAYSCGKPSFGVGQGNVQMLLDESYTDYDNFATVSVNNRNYDFGMPCTCDQTVHVPEDHFDEILAAYRRAGAYLVEDEAAVERLRKVMDKYDCVNIFVSEGACVKQIIAELRKQGEEVPLDAFGHPRLDKVNVGQYVGKRFGELLKAEKVQVFKSGYFARAAAPNKKDLKLIEKCARKAVECALNGESGVVGPDENAAAKIRACEFPRIKGGKPFNVRKGSFRKMLSEIGQPNPRKKRTVK